MCLNCFDCFNTVVGHVRLATRDLEKHGERIGRVSVIVDDKDTSMWRLTFTRSNLLRSRCFTENRQPHDKLTSFSFARTLRFDRAAVHLSQTFHQRQADTETTLSAIRSAIDLHEHLENAV